MELTRLKGIIFSSTQALPFADAVKLNLNHYCTIDVWTEGFFGDTNTLPLNTCLKKLLCYDFAVLILAADNVQLLPSTEQAVANAQVYVPRDNVIFELGAAMARFGTRKTFILTPSTPEVRLPTYLKGLYPETYKPRDDGNLQGATGAACIKIRQQLEGLAEDAHHSDLPAMGLAHGYLWNFIMPIVNKLTEAQHIVIDGENEAWEPSHGYTLTIAVPDALMSRQQIDACLSQAHGMHNILVKLHGGRDVSAYVKRRSSATAPLQIVDIPSTLMTSAEVVQRVDSYWGGGDQGFVDQLCRRELSTFARRIESLLKANRIDPRNVKVIPLTSLSDHLEASP